MLIKELEKRVKALEATVEQLLSSLDIEKNARERLEEEVARLKAMDDYREPSMIEQLEQEADLRDILKEAVQEMPVLVNGVWRSPELLNKKYKATPNTEEHNEAD